MPVQCSVERLVRPLPQFVIIPKMLFTRPKDGRFVCSILDRSLVLFDHCQLSYQLSTLKFHSVVSSLSFIFNLILLDFNNFSSSLSECHQISQHATRLQERCSKRENAEFAIELRSLICSRLGHTNQKSNKPKERRIGWKKDKDKYTKLAIWPRVKNFCSAQVTGDHDLCLERTYSIVQ